MRELILKIEMSEWFKAIKKQCYIEVSKYVLLLSESNRIALWNICVQLGYQSSGVPGQACQILERYLHGLSVKYSRIQNPLLRQLKLENVTKRFLLLVVCSIILSQKMNSARKSTNALLIQSHFRFQGVELKVADIICTEREILTALNFKIPLRNCVDIAVVLAAEMKFDPHKLFAVELIVDLAEFYKPDIESKMRTIPCTQNGIRWNGNRNISTLHLAAGAVATAFRFYYFRDVSSALAALIKVPDIYMQYLCIVILSKMFIPTYLFRNRNIKI